MSKNNEKYKRILCIRRTIQHVQNIDLKLISKLRFALVSTIA